MVAEHRLRTGDRQWWTGARQQFPGENRYKIISRYQAYHGFTYGAMSATGQVQDGLRPPVPVASGDQGRTSERTLRIVFPAHIDETGTLHDDAVAWAVVENPRWAAELRRKAGEDTTPPLMRQLRRQLKAAQAKSDLLEETTGLPLAEQPEAETFDLGQPFQPSSSLEDIPSASPLVLPSTAREAVAGAKAPAVEGFDMAQPPHDRAPRPSADKAPLIFPTIEAIEAAKNAAKAQKEPK